jgi:hypothetical protein
MFWRVFPLFPRHCWKHFLIWYEEQLRIGRGRGLGSTLILFRNSRHLFRYVHQWYFFLPPNSNYPLSLPACTIKKQRPAGVFNMMASPTWKPHLGVSVSSFHTVRILTSVYTQNRCEVSDQLHASNISWYTLDRSLNGLQNQSGYSGDQANPSPLQEMECCFPSRPVLTIVTAPTEHFRLTDNTKHSPF